MRCSLAPAAYHPPADYGSEQAFIRAAQRYPAMNLPPTNHVLVHYENVCDIDTTILDNKNAMLVLLVGAGRTTLNLSLVEKLLLHAASVQLVRLASKGKNALDFTLAYYLGCCATAHPNGFFHIISKDKGFDPLVEHLQGQHIRVRRHDDFATLNFSPRPKPSTGELAVRPPNPTPHPTPEAKVPSDGMPSEQVLAYLRKTPSNRPKTRKKLLSYVVTHLGNATSETEAESVIEDLCQGGHVVIDAKGAVTYWLDRK